MNRPTGVPNTTAWIYFMLFAALLFADAAAYRMIELWRMLG